MSLHRLLSVGASRPGRGCRISRLSRSFVRCEEKQVSSLRLVLARWVSRAYLSERGAPHCMGDLSKFTWIFLEGESFSAVSPLVIKASAWDSLKYFIV